MFGIYSTASGESVSISKDEGVMCQPMVRKTSWLWYGSRSEGINYRQDHRRPPECHEVLCGPAVS